MTLHADTVGDRDVTDSGLMMEEVRSGEYD